MGKASRDKGKRGEREARDRIRELWNAPECIRAAQSCGAWSADLLYALEGAHLEVKRYAKIAACRFLEQAIEDAKKDDQLPLLVMREDSGEWYLMMRLSDSPEFAERLSRQINERRSSAPLPEDRPPS